MATAVCGPTAAWWTTACTTAGSWSLGSTAQSFGSNPLGTTVTGAPVRSRSGEAAASLTAFRAIRRAMSGVLHGVRNAGNRKAAGRQCTVTVTGKPSFSATRTRPPRTATRHRHARARRRNSLAATPSRSAGRASGCWRSRLGSDAVAVHRNRERPGAIRRGSGVAVITSGSRPVSAAAWSGR